METEKYRGNNSTSGIQSTALSPEVTKVLRSTYMLLGTTLAFSALMAVSYTHLTLPTTPYV